jgi:uncharacterized membrane protein
VVALACIAAYRRLAHGHSIRSQLEHLSGWLARHDRRLPWILAAGAAVVLLRVKLMQHATFHTNAYDLAMYDTAVHNTLRGRFLFAEQLGRNFFSEHFSPVLLLFCPLYLVADAPQTLLVVEALVVAAGGWVAYRLARRLSLCPPAATACAVLFLNYPYLARGVLFDFHPEMFVPTLLLAAILFLLEKRWWHYGTALLLALMCKEDVPLYTLPLGLYAMVRRETRPAGALTCVVSVAWALAAWKIVIPTAMASDTAVSHFVASRWSHLGATYGEVALALLQRPAYVFSCLFSEAPLGMLAAWLWLPCAGLECLLPAVPGLVLNTTADFETQAMLRVHYAAPIVPFVAWALILGTRRLRDLPARLPRLAACAPAWRRLLPGVLLVAAAAACGADYDFHPFTPHVRARYRVMRRLPAGATVSCETGFVPHLVRVNSPTLFPVEANHGTTFRDCDYVLVDRKGNPWPLGPGELQPAIDAILADTNTFRVVAEEDGVYLFRKRAGAQPPPY